MTERSELGGVQVPTDLVAVQMVADSMEDALTQLSGRLIRHGYARPSYTQAAIEREAECPTGLPTAGVHTAIPHAGVDHALKPGIAIATLARPVQFGELGEPDHKIDVSIIFMLCVTEPEAQVYLLQSLVDMYKDADLLSRLLAGTDPQAIADEVNVFLANARRSQITE